MEAHAESAPRAKMGAHPVPAGVDRALLVVVALLILVPCFWQPYIEAGDLASHTYNAWLADQIEKNKLPGQGLSLANPLTNVLTDRIMEALLNRMGPSATERIVVGAAIEIFFWGGFLFAKAVTGKRRWIIAPSLAMIAYGLIFQAGFLNFYLSTGLSLWLMSLLWRPRRPRVWLRFRNRRPCPVGTNGEPSSGLPQQSPLLYVHGVRRVPERHRYAVFLAAVCLMILLRTPCC